MKNPAEQTDEPGHKREQAISAQSRPSEHGATEAMANNLQPLRDAVVDAAGVSTGLWLSYLFVMFYFLIAVAGVKHRDLFLENPVKLPFLGIDLPLIGFFAIGPLIFVVVHFYVLLHLVLLTTKVGDYRSELESQVNDPDERERFRCQLPNNIFVQSLAGPRDFRTGVVGFMLRLVTQITMVIGPIALLFFFQVQFLAYHNQTITWVQRVIIIIDLILLWVLWPSIAVGEISKLRIESFRRSKILALAAASLALAVFTVAVITYPDEWSDRIFPNVRMLPAGSSGWPPERKWISLHELLFVGEVNEVTSRPDSIFSNRLVLTDQNFVDYDKIEKVNISVSFRGRDLRQAALNRSDLRKADFIGAVLDDAKLEGADLRESKFGCDSTGNKSYGCTRLWRASFSNANLGAASLAQANLQGANLQSAKLQGANMWFAQLQGANLQFADLRGAHLILAQLQGANFDQAKMEGAGLISSDFSGASLMGTHLEGAAFANPNVGGVLLVGAYLQGAQLNGLELKSSWLINPQIWHARGVPKLKDSYIDKFDINTKPWELDDNYLYPTFSTWHDSILNEIMEKSRLDASIYLSWLDPSKTVTNDALSTDLSQASSFAQNNPDALEKGQADFLAKLACAGVPEGLFAKESAPMVARGILRNFSKPATRIQFTSIAETIRDAKSDPEKCPGIKGLNENDWRFIDCVEDNFKNNADTSSCVTQWTQ
jgi:uncharacterized protein YjbI with pentapeptide repeats